MNMHSFFPGLDLPSRPGPSISNLPRLNAWYGGLGLHPAARRPARHKAPADAMPDPARLRPADVLVSLAHPDDEVFLSGTAALLSRAGYRVQFVYATDGSAGLDRNQNGRVLGEKRRDEAQDSIRALGVRRVPFFLNQPDSQLRTRVVDLTQALRAVIEQVRPSLILTYGQDGITGHSDHTAVGQATDAAARSVNQAEDVYHMALSASSFSRFQEAFGRPLTEGWQQTQPVPDDQIRVRVDVKPVLSRKIEGIRHHASQFVPAEVNRFKTFNRANPVEEFTRLGS